MPDDGHAFALEATGLTRTYHLGAEPVRAVENVSLKLRRGTVNVFVGPSGSGKSTLLALLGLLESPDICEQADFRIDGDLMLGRCWNSLAELRAQKIGFLFQDARLIANMSVLENVCLPLSYRGVRRAERQGRALEALEKVGLAHRARSSTNKLSGGERQRAALARAIVGRPSLLICDEPSAALDEGLSAKMRDLLHEISRSGVTMVIATHDPILIEDAHSLHVLNRGQVQQVENNAHLALLGLNQMANRFGQTRFAVAE